MFDMLACLNYWHSFVLYSWKALYEWHSIHLPPLHLQFIVPVHLKMLGLRSAPHDHFQRNLHQNIWADDGHGQFRQCLKEVDSFQLPYTLFRWVNALSELSFWETGYMIFHYRLAWSHWKAMSTIVTSFSKRQFREGFFWDTLYYISLPLGWWNSPGWGPTIGGSFTS